MESDQLDYKLLIVDDEVAITKSLARHFRGKYTVFTVNSATEAIEVMEEHNAQVIISDQRMPGLTGVDFFNIIKDKYPDALRLIITGYSDIEAVVGAINEGQVFRYITKPWNPKELDSTIREAFDKYELTTKNRKLMKTLQDTNKLLEEKVKLRTEELEKTNLKLSKLNKEKNQYIGIVAHDLKNPIGAAQSFSELLLNDYDSYLREERFKFLNIINGRCTYALSLIENFLDASKIEAGIFELNMEKKDYVGFVKEVVANNQILTKRKKQLIRLNTYPTKVEFSFDKQKMEEVLNNLLVNASKFSLPGTTISLTITEENNCVVTEVKDQGQGIPEDELPEIFNPYKTASSQSTGGEKKTGLGLAIVKKIIDAHNGTIKVQSQVEAGSAFIFTLPKVE